LGIVGVILGFLSSWKMGLLYLIIAVILWIALSPTIRPGGSR
jgi:type IV secretory pathway VirB3-like protein